MGLAHSDCCSLDKQKMWPGHVLPEQIMTAIMGFCFCHCLSLDLFLLYWIFHKPDVFKLYVVLR